VSWPAHSSVKAGHEPAQPALLEECRRVSIGLGAFLHVASPKLDTGRLCHARSMLSTLASLAGQQINFISIYEHARPSGNGRHTRDEAGFA
jgi:hypothetical protein